MTRPFDHPDGMCAWIVSVNHRQVLDEMTVALDSNSWRENHHSRFEMGSKRNNFYLSDSNIGEIVNQ